jgi:hypothetical protein
MTPRPRWDRCISHRGAATEQFVREYFGQVERRPKLIAGAGFDPRSTRFPELLADVASGRASALFLREQRPAPRPELLVRAEENEQRLRQLIPSCAVERFDVFDIDSAPVGGRRATALLSARLDLGGVTDLVLDCSALSVGVFFPVAKYCYERARAAGPAVNFHLLVLDEPATDAAIEASPCGKANPLHTFHGRLNLDAVTDAARLWLPQLGHGRREVLKLVHQLIKPHAVCPILPFPATHPRSPDRLIEEYGELFEAVSDPFETTWHVDARDLVYAHEKSPVALYRTILRIDDARRRVFAETGGSLVILSPVGSKALALGMFMAALERDFAVVSVESIAYKAGPAVLAAPAASTGEFVHIWLHGEAYASVADTEVPTR